nr:TonB-dependent receptor [Luteimonas saliphila]
MTEIDRIMVTGSRIRQVDVETAAPVETITRDDIEKQGFKSVADILQNITAAGTPALSRSVVLAGGESAGGSYIDLRNLGANRTLVLINGRRLGIDTSGLQDVSTIPASAIERIEVLKDGASSSYGSDAIAGVINLITRSDFDGAEANASSGQYSQGDGETRTFDMVLGITGDRGSLTVTAERHEEKDVWARDRWFSANGFTDRHPDLGWTTVGQWGTLQYRGPDCTASGGRSCSYSLDRGANPFDIDNFHPQDSTPITGDVSNSNQQMHLVYPLERTSVFIDGRYQVTGNVRFTTQIGFNDRSSSRTVAGYPMQSAAFGVPMSVDSYYNPLGSHHGHATPQAVHWTRRGWELPRVSTSELTTYRFFTGLDGSFDVGDRYFDWDAGYLFSRNHLAQSNTGNFHLANLANAVGPSFLDPVGGEVVCGTPDAIIIGCIPLNPFIPFGREGDGGLTGNRELIDYLFPETHDTGLTKTYNYFANLSGKLFTLPAGDLLFAAGIEHRKEEGGYTPDALTQSGGTSGNAGGPTYGDYSVDEAYLELQAPILADLPGARLLEVTAASRYSDFDTFGDTINNKFGMRWKPTDSLLVRGTWAEGFRAPTINDLYASGSQTFTTGYHDPCDTVFGASATSATVRARCAQDIADADTYRQLRAGFVPTTTFSDQTPVPFVAGSNPSLLPETSKSKTLGVVWSPEFITGLGLALDWWKIRIDDTIVADSPNQILTDCYVEGVASRCEMFERDPVLGIVDKLEFGNRNAGFLETEGFDLDVNYRLKTDRGGSLAANWLTTYVGHGVFRSSNDSTLAPTPTNGIGGNFRIRSNLNLSWDREDFGVTWSSRYYHGTKETCLDADEYPEECDSPDERAPWYEGSRDYNHLGSTTFHDVQFRYNAPWHATIAVGINNVFAKYGPPMYTAPSSQFAYYGGYDIGRFVYLKYQQRF